MDEKFDQVIMTAVKTQEQGKELMEKLIAVAQPGAVYSEPYTSGDYTVITASEVAVGMGFGFGIGGGTGPQAPEEGTAGPIEIEMGEEQEFGGAGGGGGGGGFSQGRPVAVISIGPHGVRVEPVRDVTKIGLAFITAVGAMLLMFGRMLKSSRG
jgi:uncharacterized spore protein YtfJ